MENKPVSVWKGTLNPALLVGFVLILYTLILYFLDQTFNKYLGIISILIIVGGLIYGIKTFRDDSRGGVLTYGQGVGAGTVIGLYVGIITALFGLILYNLIDPDLINKYYLFLEDQALQQGRATEQQVDLVMNFYRKILTPITTPLFGILNYVFWGVIVSLILSIFLRREGDGFKKAMAGVEEEPAE